MKTRTTTVLHRGGGNDGQIDAQWTAAVTSTATVFNAAREARRAMDAREPWKRNDASAKA
jgi:hypothetical protein